MDKLSSFEKWLKERDISPRTAISYIDRIGFKLGFLRRPVAFMETQARVAISAGSYLIFLSIALPVVGLIGNLVFETSRFTELGFWMKNLVFVSVIAVNLVFVIRNAIHASATQLRLPPWETFESGS